MTAILNDVISHIGLVSPCPAPGGGGVLEISSEGDDQGIFLGTKIWQVFFWVA